jgi:hypothetical protein
MEEVGASMEEKKEKQEKETTTWTTSRERDTYIRSGLRRSTFRAWFAIALAIASGGWLAFHGEPPGSVLGITGLVVAAGVVLWSMAPYRNARRAYFERVQAEKSQAVEDALKRLEGENADDVLPLTALFIFNRRQLDEYQTLTKRHADVSFRNAQFAAGLGFAVLLLGVVVVVQQRAASSSVQYAIGGLSGVGVLLSTYLSHTYFRFHRNAMQQLAIYYEEPFLTSRVLSAERVIARVEALGVTHTDSNIALLVQRLLHPVQTLASGGQQETTEGDDSEQSALLDSAQLAETVQPVSPPPQDASGATRRHWWPWH